MNPRHFLAFALAVAMAGGAASAQTSAPTGIFDRTQDVGSAATPGGVVHDPDAGSYRVTASGANIWGDKDAFHYAWVQRSGDLHIAADVRLGRQGQGPAPQGRADDPPEPHPRIALCRCDGAWRRDGRAAISRRAGRADPADRLFGVASRRVRLEREGDFVYFSVAGADGIAAPCRREFPDRVPGALLCRAGAVGA
jgi:TolB protein